MQSFSPEQPLPIPALFQTNSTRTAERRTGGGFDYLSGGGEESYTPAQEYTPRLTEDGPRIQRTTDVYRPATVEMNSDAGMEGKGDGTGTSMYRPNGPRAPRERRTDDDFIPFDYAIERRRLWKQGQYASLPAVHYKPGEGKIEGQLDTLDSLVSKDEVRLGAGLDKLARRKRSELEVAQDVVHGRYVEGMEEEVEGMEGAAEGEGEVVPEPKKVEEEQSKKKSRRRAFPAIPLVALDPKEAVKAIRKAPQAMPRAPRKQLSPEAQVGIRLLAAQHPHLLTPDVLAKEFGVSYLDVQKILGAKWKMTPEAMQRKKEAWWKRGEEMKKILGYKH